MDLWDFDDAIGRGAYTEALALYGRGAFLDGVQIPGASSFEHWIDGDRAATALRLRCAA